jgi:uncharacterized protein (TIRG00374 family)
MHSRGKSLTGKLARIGLSYGVAAGCLYWAFHNLDYRELLRSFINVSWRWVPGAIILDLLAYFIGAWEWQILLRSVGRPTVWQTAQAVFAGRLANDVLPIHAGYIIRIYLVSRWTKASVAAVAPSLLVERLCDGFWLALGIGLTGIFVSLPREIARAAEVWTGIIVFGLVAGAILVFHKPKPRQHERKYSGRFGRKFHAFATQILKQLRAIGRSWVLPAGFGLSFLKFAVQGLAFLFLLWAYGFQLSLPTQVAVFLIAYVGLSMPSTPASVGVFQLFCIAALELFHVPKAIGAGFALLAFVVLTVPLSIAGFIALGQTGLTLRELRTEAGAFSKIL